MAPIGIAIVAHGFGRSRHRHYDLGRALAEAGVVAIVPDLPNVMDLWANGDAVAALVARVESGALGLPPVPRSRIVLMGTSAGGLATLLAADRMPGLAGWVGLDPVDRTGTGAEAAARLAVPAIVLLADNAHCNLFGSGRALARAAARLVRTTKIEGASHCDFESPDQQFLPGRVRYVGARPRKPRSRRDRRRGARAAGRHPRRGRGAAADARRRGRARLNLRNFRKCRRCRMMPRALTPTLSRWRGRGSVLAPRVRVEAAPGEQANRRTAGVAHGSRQSALHPTAWHKPARPARARHLRQ